ncbi:hypothetical protein [Bacillus sp. FJAT-28004]|uniref:hypothetical protein n=1 Tax=Bacillus sp. FJAT-28004 TaxID=1679165 RepID=UPI0006B5019F|nr:hypothetical protein [Bacillus sp. FJAT-28004]
MEPIKLRKLQLKDIFPMSRIIKKIGIKEIMKQAAAALEENKEAASKRTTEAKQMQAGVEMLAVVLENIHLAEKEVTDFLASLAGMESEKFAELDIEQLASVFDQFKGLPGLSSFLKQASQ